jgi:hypothetical protein
MRALSRILNLVPCAACALPLLLAGCPADTGSGDAASATSALVSQQTTPAIQAPAAATSAPGPRASTTAGIQAMGGPDAFADAAATAVALQVGQPHMGCVESPQDVDWFVVNLLPGEDYELAAYSCGGVRLVLLAEDGVTELATSSSTMNPSLRFRSARSGMHYVRVASVVGCLDYALAVQDVTP